MIRIMAARQQLACSGRRRRHSHSHGLSAVGMAMADRYVGAWMSMDGWAEVELAMFSTNMLVLYIAKNGLEGLDPKILPTS